MKFGLPISLMAHCGLGLVGLLVFGGKVKAAPEMRIIPVEILTITDTTNVRASRAVEEPTPLESVPEPDITQPVEAPDAEPDPEPEVTEPVIEEPVVEATPEPVPTETAEVDTVPDEAAEPEPEPKPEPPKPLSLDALQNLANRAKSNTPESEQRMLQSEQRQIEQAAETRAAIGLGTGLSTSYEDAIMRRVYRGWQIPAGAPDMESLVVIVKVTLSPDGRIKTAGLADETARAARSNRFLSAAADSALRAVREAEQFEFLPRPQYETWQTMTLTFYPKDAPSVVPT